MLGIILSIILFDFLALKDYNEALTLVGRGDFSLHTPIASWHMPTFIFYAI